MVEIERGVAAVAGLAEGVRAICVGGDRAVGTAEVGRHHLLGRRERWSANNKVDGGAEGRIPLKSVSPASTRSIFETALDRAP